MFFIPRQFVRFFFVSHWKVITYSSLKAGFTCRPSWRFQTSNVKACLEQFRRLLRKLHEGCVSVPHHNDWYSAWNVIHRRGHLLLLERADLTHTQHARSKWNILHCAARLVKINLAESRIPLVVARRTTSRMHTHRSCRVISHLNWTVLVIALYRFWCRRLSLHTCFHGRRKLKIWIPVVLFVYRCKWGTRIVGRL